VVLVPFLLSTAVFTRLAVIDLTLPAQSSEKIEKLSGNHLQLEVVVRPEALEVADRIGGLIERIPATSRGPDLNALQTLVQQIKVKFPDQLDATVLAEPNTSYDTLVQVMDVLRAGHTLQGTTVVRSELFPNISIGDAPLRAR
jgi:biopolymer transport protein ExbD